jgi:hypothetical protein
MPQNQEVRLPAVVADRLLEIADYQRPYAWERKQLEDLWEDIDLMGSGGTHYAGTLVLRAVTVAGGHIQESMGDDGTLLQHYEVVDGQQRLITCFILLDRVRRRLLTLGGAGIETAGAMARRIQENYGTVSVDKAQVPKLRLGSGLNGYWMSVILGEDAYVGPPLVAGQERLKEAAAFFDAKLDTLTANGRSRRAVRPAQRATETRHGPGWGSWYTRCVPPLRLASYSKRSTSAGAR